MGRHSSEQHGSDIGYPCEPSIPGGSVNIDGEKVVLIQQMFSADIFLASVPLARAARPIVARATLGLALGQITTVAFAAVWLDHYPLPQCPAPLHEMRRWRL